MEKAPKNLYIVIPAGGVGTRLWPRSREDNPKQFLKISQKRSIIQETIKRLESFIPYERIFVIAHDRYKPKFFQQVPNFLPENYISEPERRGTSGAIGLAAVFIKKRDPQGVVHFLVCDDYIKNVSRFRRMVRAAAKAAAKGKALIVYGVKPTHPATGYGYIQVENKPTKIEDIPVFKVKRFVEKPDETRAQKFIATGDYFWHGSGFTARCDVLLSEMRRKWPQGFKCLAEIGKLTGLPVDVEEGRIAKIYHQIEQIAIEYSVLEKADKVMMARLEDTWRDIANWKVIYEISKKDKGGNVVIRQEGRNGRFVAFGSKNNLVHVNNQLLALVGVDDLIIVDTKDALLICHRDEAEKVKQIVKKLKKEGRVEYL